MSTYNVIIRDGEIFINKWNGDTQAYEEKKKTEQVLSNVLQFPIEIENTTFAQFFALIVKEAKLYEQIFNAATYGHPLDPYIKEINEPATEPQDPDIDFVQIFWYAHSFENDVQISACFDGYGNWARYGHWATSMVEEISKGKVALEYTALNVYKDLPLRLNTTFEMYKDYGPLCLTGTRAFTVYDVIQAILYEITWSGDITNGRKLPEFLKDRNTK